MAERIQRVAWGLLAEWWCVSIEVNEIELGTYLRQHYMTDLLANVRESPHIDNDTFKELSTITTGVFHNTALIIDRLFGGFLCKEHKDHRHILFATGMYTWTDPESNRPLTDEDRNKIWTTIIDESKDTGPFIGGGPCCSDVPAELVS